MIFVERSKSLRGNSEENYLCPICFKNFKCEALIYMYYLMTKHVHSWTLEESLAVVSQVRIHKECSAAHYDSQGVRSCSAPHLDFHGVLTCTTPYLDSISRVHS